MYMIPTIVLNVFPPANLATSTISWLGNLLNIWQIILTKRIAIIPIKIIFSQALLPELCKIMLGILKIIWFTITVVIKPIVSIALRRSIFSI